MRFWRLRSPSSGDLPKGPGIPSLPNPEQEVTSTTVGHKATLALTAADRCDRCGAQAYVLLGVSVPHHGIRELLLCAHDYRHHERQLVLSGVRVLLDQRRQLQAKVTLA